MNEEKDSRRHWVVHTTNTTTPWYKEKPLLPLEKYDRTIPSPGYSWSDLLGNAELEEELSCHRDAVDKVLSILCAGDINPEDKLIRIQNIFIDLLEKLAEKETLIHDTE